MADVLTGKLGEEVDAGDVDDAIETDAVGCGGEELGSSNVGVLWR